MNETSKEIRAEILHCPHKLGWWLGYRMFTDLHGVWIKKIWRMNHSQDYLLLAHRNSFKTTSVVVVGVIWYLLFHPYASILLVRKTLSACEELLQLIRSIYQSQKMKYLYQAMGIVNNFHLKEEKKNRLLLSTSQNNGPEANVEIASLRFRGITGKHYDRIHLDDIVDEMDMISRKERERTKYFYYNLKNVIKFGQCITATGTPWHKNDLYSLFVNVDKYPIGSVNIFSSNSVLSNIESVITPSLFSSQYKLKILSDKSYLFKDIIMTDEWLEGMPVYGHIDCAYGGEDLNAMTIAQLTNNGYLLVVGKIFEGHIVNHYDEVVRLTKKYNIKKVFLENNFDKGFVARDLCAKGVTVSSYYERMPKYIKITTALYKNWNFLFFSKNCDSRYLEQIMEYQDDANYDDAPDSLASLLLQISSFFNFGSSLSKNTQETKEKIKEWIGSAQKRNFS